MIIDLRSDTLTKPTPGMLDAILSAKTGDDVFKEDPTVNELERRFAEEFGMETALYFPTGSMSNQAAIKLHTQPGDSLICDKWAHVYNFEAGGAAFNSGVTCKLIDGNRGMITAAAIEEEISPISNYHTPNTTLVCLENTTNKGGGACYDFNEIKKIRKVCDAYDLGLHLDGARLMNAIVAKKEDPKEYGRVFDSISICLSKGMGSPIGTVLLGNKELMKRAIRIRKVFGGAMRQIGFMAAAGLYALDYQIERLAEDHKKAGEIAEVLGKQSYIKNVEPTETNIVIFNLIDELPLDKFINDMNDKNVKFSNMGQGKLRMVTHLDYSQEMHERLLEILSSYS
ncbi:MAG: beta-eliminating lyase-related protein [Flavobacteriaceae bacterium]|nr:beta-eliminating lyase-related protein [Flavobacteriaceae bacterium]